MMLIAFVAGLVGVWLLSTLLEWVIFQRVFDDPVKGKLVSVVVAWIIGCVSYGYNTADGGPFQFHGFAIYTVPALIVGFFGWRRGLKLRKALFVDPEIFE
jgi:hypothetical protein